MADRTIPVQPGTEIESASPHNGAPPAHEQAEVEVSAPVLDRPIAASARLTWETGAWVLLLVVSAAARFFNVGERAMSHDESLHSLYSYYLYNAGNYTHDPMMHGPFLFHSNAFIYSLFGHNDFTARIVPVLFGIGVVGFAYFLRRYIGNTGAFAAAVLLSISPSMLFHSRYIRNDIYIALFTLMWIYGAMRYLDVRSFARRKWLWVMVMGMAWGFIAKENHFMHGALLGGFFTVLAVWQVIGRRAFLALGPALIAIGVAYLFHRVDQDIVAAVIALAGLLAAGAIVAMNFGKEGWTHLRRSDAADLAVLMAVLVAPFTSPFLHEVLGWDPMATQTADLVRSAGLVVVVTGFGVALAYFWYGMRRDAVSLTGSPLLRFGDWAQYMGAFWLIQVLFFTTFFTNTRGGLASGIVGSLGYWLSQQEVARGGQPWYYYTMLSMLYEFLPLILTIGGMIALMIGLIRRVNWEPTPTQDLPTAVHLEGDESHQVLLRQNRMIFVVLSAWWVVGSWLAYTIAGEKMPWLLVHIAGPLCVFGGWWFGRLVNTIDWGRARRSGALWLVGAMPGLVLLSAALIRIWPEFDRAVDALAGVMQWSVALAATAALIWLIGWSARRAGLRTAGSLLGVGGIALLLALTVRFSYMLNYINFDYATEYLVYAHGTPDIKRALREIDLISERTVGERNIVVAYDDHSAWPLSWYMRLYPNTRFYGSTPTSDVMQSPVIIVGPRNYDVVRPYVARDYVKRTYRLVWWPDQGYFDLTPQRIIATLLDRDRLDNLFQIVFYRRYPVEGQPDRFRSLTEWPNRHEFEMYVRRDIVADIWDLDLLPGVVLQDPLEEAVRAREVNLEAVAVHDAVYDDLALLRPRAVAVGPNGERVIADSGNHRIVVLDQTGALQHAFGSHCRMGEGAAGGCVGDFGPALGDGQFYEPWGVAVGPNGDIFVADTWNGRIQVFDAEGRFLRKWGYFSSTSGELDDPYALFGPRGIAVDQQGNLVVADTGNKRILHFTPEGQLIEQAGGGGVILGRFEEPTAVEVDPQTGFVFVADAWNRRVQVLSADLEPLAEWPVPGWSSREIFHKPSITRAANGDIYLTDPQLFRVLVLSPLGEIKAAFGSYGPELNRFGLPNGLAYDPADDQILVADADNNRILAFPALP